MGTVYLAEHMLIKRKVAIKILRPELAEDAQVVERFMNEARAAGAIGHPHIVESTDMGFTRDEVPFIVFEYLEGTLLTDEIYRVKGMPPRRALAGSGTGPGEPGAVKTPSAPMLPPEADQGTGWSTPARLATKAWLWPGFSVATAGSTWSCGAPAAIAAKRSVTAGSGSQSTTTASTPSWAA